MPLSCSALTESAAEQGAGDQSVRAARSAAAGGWEAEPAADSIQPTAHHYPSIPHRVATASFIPVCSPSAAGERAEEGTRKRSLRAVRLSTGLAVIMGSQSPRGAEDRLRS
ncbi:hypothetical protein [Nitrospira sp.]|uniref:hypothetical protein n=1 Tax=Nitrospira sp. TaxID=70125 RepID=UPI003FCD1AD5